MMCVAQVWELGTLLEQDAWLLAICFEVLVFTFPFFYSSGIVWGLPEPPAAKPHQPKSG